MRQRMGLFFFGEVSTKKEENFSKFKEFLGELYIKYEPLFTKLHPLIHPT